MISLFSQEFLWRSGASFLWFVFLLPAISVVYLTLVLFSLNHPIAWITGTMCGNLVNLQMIIIHGVSKKYAFVKWPLN